MNDIFTFIFLTEAIFKIAGLGFGGYWQDSWNKFDGMVVLASLVDIGLKFIFPSIAIHYEFLRIGP